MNFVIVANDDAGFSHYLTPFSHKPWSFKGRDARAFSSKELAEEIARQVVTGRKPIEAPGRIHVAKGW